jgi:hypothetical protein
MQFEKEWRASMQSEKNQIGHHSEAGICSCITEQTHHCNYTVYALSA